jgi:hypothetical protein
MTAVLVIYFIKVLELIKGKKGEVHPGTCHKGPEGEQRYSSLFL